VRDRADVVLLWRADPRAEHPDLLPDQVEAGGGPRKRQVFLLAPPGAPAASFGADLEALQALRARLSRPAPAADDAVAAAIREARFVAVVWDPEAARGPGGTAIVTAIARLVRDLDARGRAVARSIGAGGNLAGAMSALLSECGLPRAVRFESPGGAAAHDPFDGATPGERGDRLLVIGARGPLGGTVPAAIVVGPDLPEGCPEPEVFIPTAVPGLTGRGTWMRADGVAWPVRGPLPASAPLEEEILDLLEARLPARAAVVA
jgi:formylmethanofuran dehydrogenase subunit B